MSGQGTIALLGSVGDFNYRPDVIPTLLSNNVKPEHIFDPVLPPGMWDEKAQQKEDEIKRRARYCLYVIRDPKQFRNPVSTYSIHEVTRALLVDQRRTFVVFDRSGMSGHPLTQMVQVEQDLRKDVKGAKNRIFSSIDEVIKKLVEEYNSPNLIDELIVLDGTVGFNNWRPGFIDDLVAAGVKSESIINPALANWTAQMRKFEKKMQKKSTIRMFYLASPCQPDNPLSTIAWERAQVALSNPEKAYDTVVVFNNDGITGHHLKSFTKMQQDFEGWFSRYALFNNLADAKNWIVSRVGVDLI